MNRATLLCATALLGMSGGASAQLVPALNEAPQRAQQEAAAPVVVNQGGGAQAAFVPDRAPPPLSIFGPDRALAARERRNVATAARWRMRACSPSHAGDGVLRFQQGACEITVVAAPFQITDVALEPGEVPTAVPDVGDVRVGLQKPRFSGGGMERTLHLVFIPSDVGLNSGVSLQTDRRTVTFKVVTRQREYMPLVAIDNTARSSTAGWMGAVASTRGGLSGDPCDQAPTVPPQAFHISSSGGWFGSAPAWKPVQVYGVQIPSGTATCVEFPADINSIDAPILVPRDGPSGDPGIDNVRASGRRYRVDRDLSRFELIAGIGYAQERVSITRRSYR